MEKQPIFTVIVPTYNREHYLKRSIDSILAQTFKDFELIVVDDGSEDNTREIINSYDDNRIVYIYKENGGINSARNKALLSARGKYIAFCDSDDSWLPTKLEKHMLKYSEDAEIKLVYDLTGILESENGDAQIVLARNDTCEGWCYKEVLHQGYLTSPTFLSCKKECFDKAGMMALDLTNCEDDDFCFRLTKHFKVGLIKEILGIKYTDAPNSITKNKKLCADDFFKFQEKWSGEILSVCGADVLKRRYYQASYKYVEINEMDKAQELYQKACKIGDTPFDKIRHNFAKKFMKSGMVIIYGAGYWGEIVYRTLKMMGSYTFIFAVTDIVQPPHEQLYGVPIKKLSTLSHLAENTPLIIASSQHYADMKSMAEKEGFFHLFSYEEIINAAFNN